MKKSILILGALLLIAAHTASAIPAKKGTFVKIQPDGTRITLQRHGDEFLHWTTTEDGTVVAPDASGFYRVSVKPTQENLGGRDFAMQQSEILRIRRAAARRAEGNRASSVNYYRFPVILVQFSDVKFTSNTANEDFSRLLNQEGYSDNGATGSVHDYYWENSMGTFHATFDVYGPYTYNGTCAANADENDAAKMLWAAIKEYDSKVDWSQYDNDNDGTVDMVFMYYAGWNEAEGEDDTIWPHKYNFSYAGVSTTTLDKKSFDVYACTSELKGTSSSNGGMCGIGTCAHEFSHTQGLPDFYDVNYDNYGDGEAGATYSYDIMCAGGYNNGGRTPPYFTAEERIMMGWMAGYETLPSDREISIPSVNTNFAYKMATSNTSGDGEYFVFECRSGQGWDAYVEPGLVVYHADKSKKYNIKHYTSQYSSTTNTGYQLWTSSPQYINANGDHPCFYIVPAADQDNLNYGGSESKLPFPGKAEVPYYCPKDWEGNTYDLFTDICFHSDGARVTMTRGRNYPGLCGFVKNSSGEAIRGATVSIYVDSGNSSLIIGSTQGPAKISGRIPENIRMSTETDEAGYYSFDLSKYSDTDVDIEVIASGYITKYETISVSDILKTKNFTLRGVNEPVSYTLRKFDALTPVYGLGYGSTCNTYASICLTSDELAEHAGRKILELGFAYSTGDDGSVSKVYGIIDADGSRVLTSQVTSPKNDDGWYTVDVSSNNLYIEAGKDYHFGYGLLNCTYGYPMLFTEEEPMEGGFNYYLANGSTSVANSFTWSELSGYGNLLIYVKLDDSTEVDYNAIYNPGYGNYSVGDTFALRLVEAEGSRKPGTEIQWFFDDEPVSGESITLKYAGYHLVEARFTTAEGKMKVVELEITVGL